MGGPRRNRLGQRERSRLPVRTGSWPRQDAQGAARPGAPSSGAVRRDRSFLHRPDPRTAPFVPPAVKVTRFDVNSDLIIVKARIWGPGGRTPASLAVDTGQPHSRRHRALRSGGVRVVFTAESAVDGAAGGSRIWCRQPPWTG